MNTSTLLQRQSDGINALRFILIVVVVFIHVLPNKIFPIEGGFFSGGAYYYTSELISHIIGRAAVPAFFLISGYYALYSGKDYARWSIFWGELRKKSRSLLLPYIIWASLAVIIVLCKQWTWDVIGIQNTDILRITPPYLHKSTNLLWAQVYAYQLWYLRDLICMTLLLPLFYIIAKRVPWLMGTFPLLYLLGWDIGIKGFSSVALCFFSLGCLLGYYRIAILHWAHRLRHIILLLMVAMLALPFFNQAEWFDSLMRPFIFAIVGGFLLLTHYVSLSKRPLELLLRLNRYTFFIYCTHTILIISHAKGLLLRLTPPLEALFPYFSIVGLTILICIALYELLYRLCPRLLAISLGGRL